MSDLKRVLERKLIYHYKQLRRARRLNGNEDLDKKQRLKLRKIINNSLRRIHAIEDTFEIFERNTK